MNTFALLKLLIKPKTRKQLLEITKLPERTLRYRLAKLKKMKLIEEMISLKDARVKLYVVKNKQ
ncbi:MAG: hypothetical protein J7K83_01000 [Candidatus Aenigmarchaeota archaeon]|nr:hypothetical protein [Candidatus Aenigmarchaeota archaeon]